jgi:hypothetical protein
MKKLSILIAACFIFISTESISAEALKEHVLKVGPEISYIKYKEPGLMEEKGVMYGISASYTYHKEAKYADAGMGGYIQLWKVGL